MAIYPLQFDFNVSLERDAISFQVYNTMSPSDVVGTFACKILTPSGGIIRSSFENVPEVGPLFVSGSAVFQPIVATLTDINVNSPEEGQFQKPDGTNTVALEADLDDGLYTVTAYVSVNASDEFTSTKYFIISHQTKALLLNKLEEIHRTYPQIPYSMMYSGTEKRVIRSLMLLQAAEIELSRGNVEGARQLTETVIRYTKTWLTL